MPLRLLLAVEEAAGLKALRLALESEHEVIGVLTTASEERGSSAWRLASDHGIEIHDPGSVRKPSFAGWMTQVGIDLLINVHSLHIADAKVVEAPRIGSFNLHPGPLPDYRGLNAPSWAIYDGRDDHAVTLHWMSGDVDAGPIAYETRFEIGPADTGLKVSARCVTLGMNLIGRLLEDAASGDVPAFPQPSRSGVWHGAEVPNEGWIDWREPAWRIVALMRAADFRPLPSPWGHPRTRLGNMTIELVEAEATDDRCKEDPGMVRCSEHGVLVATPDTWLTLTKIRVDGRSRPAAELLETGVRLI